jgi:YVTN family beta-propeller protein
MRRSIALACLTLAALSMGAAKDAPDFAHGGEVSFGGSRWRLAARAPTGSMPWGASVSPDGKWLYVTHVGEKDHDNVFRYDAATLDVRARAQFAGHAVESVPSADGRLLYVTNSRKHELLVLDALGLEVRQRHATGKIPKDFRLAPDESVAYVADYGGGTLSALDLTGGAARRTVKVGKHPRGVALTRDGTTAVVTDNGGKTVSIVDTRTLAVTDTVTVCPSPRHAAITDDGATVLVTCLASGQLAVLDAARGAVTRKVPVGKGPKTVVITRDQTLAITADERGDSLTFVDLKTWDTRTVPLPADRPCGLALSPDDRRLYVTARGSNEVLVIERSVE